MNIHDDFDVKEATDSCIRWIRSWFEANGRDCNAIIGISGGKDSSVAAALCCKAIGKDRVIGILMPNGVQNDIKDAQALVNYLGIKSYQVNIADAVEHIHNVVMQSLLTISRSTEVNLPARIRMTTLYAFSQSLNGRVVNTCNLSEDWIGYSTKYGDAAGDFSPLAHFTVSEVRAIGEFLGLPSSLVYKIPSDGLCGRSDEDSFGFSYDVLDRYIRTGQIDDAETKNKIDRMHRDNLFKLKLMPSFKYKEDAGW